MEVKKTNFFSNSQQVFDQSRDLTMEKNANWSAQCLLNSKRFAMKFSEMIILLIFRGWQVQQVHCKQMPAWRMAYGTKTCSHHFVIPGHFWDLGSRNVTFPPYARIVKFWQYVKCSRFQNNLVLFEGYSFQFGFKPIWKSSPASADQPELLLTMDMLWSVHFFFFQFLYILTFKFRLLLLLSGQILHKELRVTPNYISILIVTYFLSV